MKVVFCITAIASLLAGCACPKYVSYQANRVDIAGIQMKTGKVETNVASVTIGRQFRDASEKLQTLDLLQARTCEAIRDMRESSAKDKRKSEFVDTLLCMQRITLNPSITSCTDDSPPVASSPPQVCANAADGMQCGTYRQCNERLCRLHPPSGFFILPNGSLWFTDGDGKRCPVDDAKHKEAIRYDRVVKNNRGADDFGPVSLEWMTDLPASGRCPP